MPSRLRKAFDEVGVHHAIVVGKLFTFKASQCSHEHELTGTVTGAAWSDESGLDLFVSVPTFWGRPLKSLKCMQTIHGLQWHAYMHVDRTEVYKQIDALDKDAEDYDDKVEKLISEFLASQFVVGDLVISEKISALA